MKTILATLLLLLVMHDCGACYGAPIDARPPIDIILDFKGSGPTIWDNKLIPATPAFTGDAAAVVAMVAENFKPFNVVVTTGSTPGVQGRSVRVVIGGNGSWFPGATGVTNLFEIYEPEPTAWVFAENLLNRADLVAAVATHELGHVGGCEHQSIFQAISGMLVKTAEYAPGYFMGDTSTSNLVWGVGTSSSGKRQDDVAILNTTYGAAAVPDTIWGAVAALGVWVLGRRTRQPAGGN